MDEMTWSVDKPPYPLNEDADLAWKRWAPDAMDNGTLHDTSVFGFVELCEAWADEQMYRRALREHGVIMQQGNGQPKTNPAASQLESAKRTVDSKLRRFGLDGVGSMDLNKRRLR